MAKLSGRRRAAALTDPAVVIGLGLVLTLFNGNWSYLGLPPKVAPDRILLLLGAVLLVAQARGEGRRRWRPGPVHVVMLLALCYATASALKAGTAGTTSGLFGLTDHFGLIPFAMFVIGPMAFHDERRRSWLLAGFVAVGAYLSITTIAEIIGPKSLVFPRYILDPTVGIHYGRGRGPFLEAAVNGVMLLGCAVAAIIAARTWRRPASRRTAFGVAALCMLGILLTLQRSAWVSAAAALAGTILIARPLRRYLLPTAASLALIVGLALSLAPGLAARVNARKDQQETIWQRDNALVAGLGMVQAKPLFGVGWNRFLPASADYWRLSPNYPLDVGAGIIIHNVYVSYAAELGLVGLSLWLLAVALGIGVPLLTRGPPELALWRLGLLPVAIMWLVSSVFTPMLYLAPNVLIWLWAGIVFGDRQFEQPVAAREAVVVAAPRRIAA